MGLPRFRVRTRRIRTCGTGMGMGLSASSSRERACSVLVRAHSRRPTVRLPPEVDHALSGAPYPLAAIGHALREPRSGWRGSDSRVGARPGRGRAAHRPQHETRLRPRTRALPPCVRSRRSGPTGGRTPPAQTISRHHRAGCANHERHSPLADRKPRVRSCALLGRASEDRPALFDHRLSPHRWPVFSPKVPLPSGAGVARRSRTRRGTTAWWLSTGTKRLRSVQSPAAGNTGRRCARRCGRPIIRGLGLIA